MEGPEVVELQRAEDRNHLLERLRLAERRQRLLADTTRLLAASLDTDRMLEQLARALVPTLADGCSLYLLGDDGSVERAAVALSELARERLRDAPQDVAVDPADEEGLGRVLRTGVPVLYRHVPDALLQAVAHDEEHLRTLRALGLESVIIVPMLGRGRTVGALALFTLEAARIYGSDDLSLAEELGHRAGLSLSNIQLYERERSVAHALQKPLRPPTLPDIPGIELAGRFHPGGEGLRVGGDFYDGFPIGPEAWAVAIGDVCGAGPEAASLTTRVRYSARALASADRRPGEVLGIVNRLLWEEHDEPLFCTAVYGWLRRNGSGASVILANAGHPAPLVLRADGRLQELECSGTLLGVFTDAESREEIVELGPGDALLLFTDGVIEARGGRGRFGHERLAEAVVGAAGLSAAGLADRVRDAVLEFTDRPGDDIALLAVRVLPGAG